METGTVLERGGTPESTALKNIRNDIKKRKLSKTSGDATNLVQVIVVKKGVIF